MAGGRVTNGALAAADLLASGLIAGALGSAAVLRRLSRRRPNLTPPKLLALEATYALETVQARKSEHAITGRDLQGFFDHVWSVHPAVGASPDHSEASSVGMPSSVSLSPRHTVIEGKVAHTRRLHRVPRTNFSLAQAALVVTLSRLIRREKISIIWASDPYYLGLLGMALARAHRVRVVVCVYGNFDKMYEATGSVAYPRLIPSRRLEKRIERYVLSRADLVVAANEDNLQFALRNGATEERSALFRPGHWIHPDHFDVEPEQRRRSPAELGLGERPYLILVGRLVPLKRPDDVLAVLAQVKASGRDLVAVIVGDGPMRQQLEDMAADMGLAGDVVFTGNRDQPWIASALASAEVVLSPLTGLALIEACLSGTAVVAYDVEWQSELVQSDETGILVPDRDTEGMAKAVLRLLDDPDHAARLGRSARLRAREMMDPQKLLDYQRTAYERVLSEPYRQRTAVHQR